MVGIRGISPLRLTHQSIPKALESDRIYTVNFHAREHIFGDLFDDTKGKSYLDIEIDLCKLVASLIKYPRNCEHKPTHSGVHSVSYENTFTSSLGTCQDSDTDERGHIVFIKISEEHCPEFTQMFDYYLVTLIISENWRILHPNGPQCQQNPNQRIISRTSVLREIRNTHP